MAVPELPPALTRGAVILGETGTVAPKMTTAQALLNAGKANWAWIAFGIAASLFLFYLTDVDEEKLQEAAGKWGAAGKALSEDFPKQVEEAIKNALGKDGEKWGPPEELADREAFDTFIQKFLAEAKAVGQACDTNSDAVKEAINQMNELADQLLQAVIVGVGAALVLVPLLNSVLGSAQAAAASVAVGAGLVAVVAFMFQQLQPVLEAVSSLIFGTQKVAFSSDSTNVYGGEREIDFEDITIEFPEDIY